MGKVYVYGPKDDCPDEIINTTSRSKVWFGLSPFFLSPVNVNAYNIENVWQYSKVYKEHVDENNDPTDEYFKWRKDGFSIRSGIRYTMGKGALPLYSYWNGEKLDYVEARKKIYVPQYSQSVIRTEAYKNLYDIYINEEEVHLWDFDGYKYTSLLEVLNNPKKKMGHSFVLAALLKNNTIPLYGKY